MEINMDLPATKEELLNAGFEGGGIYLYLKGIDLFSISWRTDYINNFIFNVWDDGEFLLKLECPTKTELNKMIYPFIKRELDFTKKEKDYSFEECLNKKMHYFIFKGHVFHHDSNSKHIEYSPSYATREAAKQALALSKLSFIIAKIDKDHPGDNLCKSFSIHYNMYAEEFIITIHSNKYKRGFGASTASNEGAEILIKQHPELLKAALMVS